MDPGEMSGSEVDACLTDDQIEGLLSRAEARLKGNVSRSNSITESRTPKHVSQVVPKAPVNMHKSVARADRQHLVDPNERVLASGVRKVEDPVALNRRRLQEKQATAGSDWFNLPQTDLTPELKRDLQLLRMRNVLDPHRHYKKESSKIKPPKFSQVGTLIEGPTEFYSARLTNDQRKKSLVEEVLSGERETGRFKRKYGDVQAAKTSGKKAHYKALMAKKYKKSYRNK